MYFLTDPLLLTLERSTLAAFIFAHTLRNLKKANIKYPF